MEPQKIIKVIRTVREGVSKKTNKPYSIVLVQTEGGDEVEVFGPANSGDMVKDITYDQTYDQLKGTVVKPDKNIEIMASLERIERLLKWLVAQQRGDVAKTTTPKPAVAPAPKPVKSAPVPSLKQAWADTVAKAEPEPLPSEEDYPADMLEGIDYDEPTE